MPPKKKVRHGSTSTVLEEVQHDPFMPRHPLDEHECDKLIAKRPIIVECVILIAGFEEHGVAELLDFYKLRPFILMQECYPTPCEHSTKNIEIWTRRNICFTLHSRGCCTDDEEDGDDDGGDEEDEDAPTDGEE
ncbi:hypothetical protein AAG906_018643 [Vitis piasezkii]